MTVPTALADFPAEDFNTPTSWAHHYLNVVRFTRMTRGGHFAAFEEPQLFVDDVSQFVEEIEKLSVEKESEKEGRKEQFKCKENESIVKRSELEGRFYVGLG